MDAAASALLRSLPVVILRLHHHQQLALAPRLLPQQRRTWLWSSTSATEPTRPEKNESSADNAAATLGVGYPPPPDYGRMDHPDFRKWRIKELEILSDIEPIVSLAKRILHSKRYVDGALLTAEDEKAIIEKLLVYHPHYEDKIGCGLDSIMVDCHPQFRNTRCLFIIRTDGAWIDFSYQKCLREYIRRKYPSYAEKFIREHFKRGSGK